MNDMWTKQYLIWFDVLKAYRGLFSPDQAAAMLEAYELFCRQEIESTNVKGDQQGVAFNPKTGAVKTPQCFREVYDQMKALGYVAMGIEEQYGGLGVPQFMTYACMECQAGSNLALSTFPLLTQGAIDTLIQNASPDIVDRFVPKMISGQWSGTMCLTEPQCGTDLGLIKTIANADGDAYQVSGTKIWITFGEHDLTENIIHLVLCRTENAPEGTKGLSLMVVPKFIDGKPNGVQCGGLEQKMGSHASPTCVMHYNKAKGWLVGARHEGLKAMFSMMNPARLSVGVQALGAAQRAHEWALQFCRERRQGRSVNPQHRDQEALADVITVHPDVRRMLLGNQALIEAMRGLVVLTAKALDDQDHDFASLMTPVIKSFLSEHGCECISQSIQVMGGAGYTRDARVEQYLRDARITMIYEGTNGVQALDLVGRKLLKYSHVLQDLISKMNSLSNDDGAVFKQLNKSVKRLCQANDWMMAEGIRDPESVLAVACDYLNLLGYVMCFYVWSLRVKSHGPHVLADVFVERYGPMVELCWLRIQAGKGHLYDDFKDGL